MRIIGIDPGTGILGFGVIEAEGNKATLVDAGVQIKQALTGYGRAEKKQMQEMVRVLLGLPEVPKPDDCADALATALMHASSVKVK
jgi:crossover junction endodeoxyribonuclease RuvC